MKSLIILFVLLLIQPLVAGSQSFEADNELLPRLNSPFDENYVVVHPHGHRMAFTRSNYPYNQGGKQDTGDIWLSRYDSTWQLPADWHQVNSDHFSSPIGWTSDGSTFLFNKVSTKGGLLSTEIWALSGSNLYQVDIPYFKNTSDHQSACISADNRVIIVSMESGSSMGVEDLYVIMREGNGWSAPKNLGSVINTTFQEITPFLSPDMRTLYFATNGRKGFGSFDIYSSERLDDTWRNWSTPQNLGAAVNSGGRETSFTYAAGADYAYFISTRNSDGYGDIRRVKFLVEKPKEVVKADTTVFAKKEEIRTVSGLQLINAKTSDPIVGAVEVKSEGVIGKLTPNAQGILPMSGTEVVEISVNGYMSARALLERNKLVIVYLEPLEVGRIIRLESVLFVRGSATIVDSSFGELDRVVAMLKSNPDIRILLKGHTDGNGDKTQNIKLSQQRVETVKSYLVSKGIPKKRIEGVGLGGEEPIASNQTEETRKLNRRVEFEIIE